MARKLPLPSLLTQALAAFTAEFEQEVAEAGFPELSLALGTNVLRFLAGDDGGRRVGALAALAGVTKQAISQQVGYLEKHGYVTTHPDPADSRAKVVRLTERGLRSQEVCRPLFGTVERRWRRRYGDERMGALRDALEAVAGQHRPPSHAASASPPDGRASRSPAP